MKKPDHVDYLRRFLMWRSGRDDRTMEEAGLSPRGITDALVAAIDEIRVLRRAHTRYEKLRRLSPREFMALWNESITRPGANFDRLVDKLKGKP